jgi:hypothetical protein
MPWHSADPVQKLRFTCWMCGNLVAPSIGYHNTSKEGWYIGICPNCDSPTFLMTRVGKQIPGRPYGKDVDNVPGAIEGLYKEARNCMSVSAYTAASLACRKILMNVAVHLGADPNRSFVFYVDYLDRENHIPAGSKGWVDYIRTLGNEATHEIPSVSQADAKRSISFTEMLLKIVFEFPATLPP